MPTREELKAQALERVSSRVRTLSRKQRSEPEPEEKVCGGCGLLALTDPCFYCEELETLRGTQSVVTQIAGPAPQDAYPFPQIPSVFKHRHYSVQREYWEDGYDSGTYESRIYTENPRYAQLISSELDHSYPGGKELHCPVLDIDFPVGVVPSSTPGHFHLYLDTPMPWRSYKRLLKALGRAGILEPGYVKVSLKRCHTAVRLPWVRKGHEVSPGLWKMRTPLRPMPPTSRGAASSGPR